MEGVTYSASRLQDNNQWLEKSVSSFSTPPPLCDGHDHRWELYRLHNIVGADNKLRIGHWLVFSWCRAVQGTGWDDIDMGCYSCKEEMLDLIQEILSITRTEINNIVIDSIVWLRNLVTTSLVSGIHTLYWVYVASYNRWMYVTRLRVNPKTDNFLSKIILLLNKSVIHSVFYLRPLFELRYSSITGLLALKITIKEITIFRTQTSWPYHTQ